MATDIERIVQALEKYGPNGVALSAYRAPDGTPALIVWGLAETPAAAGLAPLGYIEGPGPGNALVHPRAVPAPDLPDAAEPGSGHDAAERLLRSLAGI